VVQIEVEGERGRGDHPYVKAWTSEPSLPAGELQRLWTLKSMRTKPLECDCSTEVNRGAQFITVAEISLPLRVNPQTVRNWIVAGTLPALKVGRRIRIQRTDFEEFLNDARIRARGSVETSSLLTRADEDPAAHD
jgi:excisionase family DNA binding protein